MVKVMARRFKRRQTGFTLVEVLVAVFIIATVGIAGLRALDTNSRAVRGFDERVTANNLATAYIEAVKALPYSDTYADPGTLVTIPPQYHLDVIIEFSSDGASADGITWVSTYSGQTIQKLSVIVSREGASGPILVVCAFKTDRGV